MYESTVKKFDTLKGYGFLYSEHGDVFVHHTAIQAHGNRNLAFGDKVRFDIVLSEDNRLRAANVVLIDETAK